MKRKDLAPVLDGLCRVLDGYVAYRARRHALTLDAEGERWVTVHPNGEEHAGRHVKIDSNGNIIGGSLPRSAQGKHITGWWKKEQKPEPRLHQHLRGQSTAFTHFPDTGSLETGHGLKRGTDKWGRPEPTPGNVGVHVSGKPEAVGKYLPLESAFADKDRLKALGAKWGPQLAWDFPKQWYLPVGKLPSLLKEMPHSTVSKEAVQAYEDWATKNEPASPVHAALSRVAAEQASRAAIAAPFEMPEGMNREAMTHGDLHPYQKEGVEFLLNAKRAILGHGVGLGKTIQSITAARIAQQKEHAGPFLIIAPSSRKYGWEDEIKKFSPGASSVVIDATLSPKKQEERWQEAEAKKPDFIVTNYETLQDPEKAERLHKLAPNVIADEAHRLKNDKAKTTKGFEKWKDAKYAWLRTATPFPNGAPRETRTMLEHTIPGITGGFKTFEREHVVTETQRAPFGTVKKWVALKNIPQLREKAKSVLQVRQMTDPDIGLQLPDRRRVDVRLDMTPRQSRLYEQIRSDVAREISGMSDEEFRQQAPNVLTKLKRLEQVALDPDLALPEKERSGELSPKESWAVETIGQHLEEPKNRGIVLFADSRLPLDKIADTLKAEGIEPRQITGSESPAHRQETERMFSDGKVKVVLATSAAEEGMNLQHGGHTMIHLDVPWVPKSTVQREGRIHRQGQPSAFTTHFHPVMPGTVEQRKQGVLAEKARRIDELLGTHEAENMAVGNALSRKEIMEMLGLGDGGSPAKAA